jgi:pimeloyl-ACP methyl ester carboxylesterase
MARLRRTTTRRKAALSAGVAAALLLAALFATVAADDGAALDWGGCAGDDLDPRQQCATLDVPRDHDEPHGERIELAVSRIPAADPDARRGTLFLVPGGPGEPGLSDPTAAARSLPQEVLSAYDLVSFDPRGIARSTPVSCGLAHEDLSLVRLRPWPGPDGGIAENAEIAEHLADVCAAHGGPLLGEISTANEARDIDLIRQTLGPSGSPCGACRTAPMPARSTPSCSPTGPTGSCWTA